MWSEIDDEPQYWSTQVLQILSLMLCAVGAISLLAGILATMATDNVFYLLKGIVGLLLSVTLSFVLPAGIYTFLYGEPDESERLDGSHEAIRQPEEDYDE
ncbi:hypothetical protein H0W80_02020 [Candidatus Saccharibacteria bacterium]|nr:hypothetical protein [Candidatus Saccharibacteria bacterium]